MIGSGCLIAGKYNMTAVLYTKGGQINPNTGQVKAVYSDPKPFSLVARGLANLRGKDSGTIQDYGNRLVEYHYLRVKAMEAMDEGDIITNILDAGGRPYLEAGKQFVVIGVTPTYDPFGSFIEYDILCDEAESKVSFPEYVYSGDSGDVVGGGSG